MKAVVAILMAIVVIGMGIFTITCIEVIPAGSVGIIYNMNGGVEEDFLSQGWHWLAPSKKAILYSIGLEQSYLTASDKGDSPRDESFFVPTSDGKTVKVEMEFSYMFDVDRVSDTFTRFKGRSGVEIKNSFIKPKVMAWTSEITANHSVTDLFGDKRTQINSELDVYLKEKFDPYGIIIDTVNFTSITVDEETSAAIQRKVNAQQENELAAIEAETAKIEAEKEKEVAKIEAEKLQIEAEAEALVTTTKAKAEAEANKAIAESLTPSFIDYVRSQRWDGSLPTVQGSSALPMIDFDMTE